MSALNGKTWPAVVAAVAIAALTFAAGWSLNGTTTGPEVTLDRFLATVHSLPESGKACVLPVEERELERLGEMCGLYAKESAVEVLVGERVLVEWVQWKGSDNESAFDVLHLTSP